MVKKLVKIKFEKMELIDYMETRIVDIVINGSSSDVSNKNDFGKLISRDTNDYDKYIDLNWI